MKREMETVPNTQIYTFAEAEAKMNMLRTVRLQTGTSRTRSRISTDCGKDLQS